MKDTYVKLRTRFTEDEAKAAVQWLKDKVLILPEEKAYRDAIWNFDEFLHYLYNFPDYNPVEAMHELVDKCQKAMQMFDYACLKLESPNTVQEINVGYMELLCVWKDALKEGMQIAGVLLPTPVSALFRRKA